MNKKKILVVLTAMIISLCAVFVTVDAATKVKLTKKSVAMYEGDSIFLKVKGTKSKIKWSSKNKKVAVVTKKGKVKAVKKGRTVIYAKFRKKVLKCKITVNEKITNKDVIKNDNKDAVVNETTTKEAITKEAVKEEVTTKRPSDNGTDSEEETNNNITIGKWVVMDLDGRYAIEGYHGSDKEITVPNELNGVKVWLIDSDAFMDNMDVEKVVVSYGIQIVRSSAFEGCDYLKTVVLPESVTGIGDRAFKNCYELESVNVPSGVETIGEETFMGCSSLTSIQLPDDLEEIDSSAFNGSGITNIVIPDKVTAILSKTFMNCKNLESVTLGNKTRAIGFLSFENCSNLKNIVLPETLEKIGMRAFAGCTSLESVTVYAGEVDILKDVWIKNPNYSRGEEPIPLECTIIGVKGSLVEAYAMEYGLKFEEIEE